MSRQKKCLYQKIIALVCLFAVCLTGFAAYFAIKNTGSVQAAEYTFTDSSGNQVGDGGRIAMRRSRDTFAVLGIQSNDVCTWQSLNPSLVEIENADAAGFVRFNLFIGIICEAVCQRVFSLEAFFTQEMDERCGGAVVLDGDLAIHTDGETADLVGKAGCTEVFGFFAGVFSNGCDQLLAVGTADVVVDNHIV